MHTQNECHALLHGVHYVQNGNENLVIAQRHPSERDADYMLAFIKLLFVRLVPLTSFKSFGNSNRRYLAKQNQQKILMLMPL